jgi:acyl-CoA dehydrogenase
MNEFAEPLQRLLAGIATPAAIRAVEGGGPCTGLWQQLAQSGFLDAMAPEAAGGAGLALRDAFELFVVDGGHATPVPLAHTMLARAVLGAAGARPPQGPIAIASSSVVHGDGRIDCRNTPYGLVAEWVVAATSGGWWLLPVSAARRESTGIHGSLRADLSWPDAAAAAHASDRPLAWRDAGAVLCAAQIAGAMERVLELTVRFANDRVQFGRPIGKFQAIQHQLAVMAEQCAAARMAAEIGCRSDTALPDPLRAAAAKARASEAAALVAPLAHAVHGAIGITAELDLQLFTRRLHEWRADFGSERAWNLLLGRALLAGEHGLTLDFLRDALLPA